MDRDFLSFRFDSVEKILTPYRSEDFYPLEYGGIDIPYIVGVDVHLIFIRLNNMFFVREKSWEYQKG